MEANWKLLPDSPELFFGLAAGYSQKDLKRAYTRLIKKYKPESAPDEFSKIRAAYEVLTGRLDYNIRIPSTQEYASPPTVQHHSTQSEITPHTSRPDTPRRSLITIPQRISDGQTLQTIYDDIKSQTQKSPQDYISLAFLEETITGSDTALYNWLIEGIQYYPTEASLNQSLYEYLQTDIPVERVLAIIRKCHTILESHQFFYLTEHCWNLYYEQSGQNAFFELFHELNDIDNIEGSNGCGIFLLRFLQTRIFDLDCTLTEQCLEQLESRIDEFNDDQVLVFNQLGTLYTYRLQTAQFLSKESELRQEIDAIIRDFSKKKRTETIPSFLALCVKITNHPDLETEFPLNEPAAMVCADALRVIADEIEAELGIEVPELSFEQEMEHIINAYTRIDKASEHHKVKWCGCISIIVFLFSSGILISAVIYGYYYILKQMNIADTSKWLDTTIIVVSVLAFTYPYTRWIHRIVALMDLGYNRRNTALAYKEMWRPEMVRLMERTRLSISIIAQYQQQLSNEKHLTADTHADDVNTFATVDAALSIQNTARRFK